MRWLIPRFPSGRAGIGLILLRLSTIVALLIGTYGEFAPTVHGRAAMFCWVLVLPLGAGLATLLFSVISLLASVGLLFTSSGLHPECIALTALLSLSLAMLGPGAYSADALLFGRRVVMFKSEQDRPDR